MISLRTVYFSWERAGSWAVGGMKPVESVRGKSKSLEAPPMTLVSLKAQWKRFAILGWRSACLDKCQAAASKFFVPRAFHPHFRSSCSKNFSSTCFRPRLGCLCAYVRASLATVMNGKAKVKVVMSLPNRIRWHFFQSQGLFAKSDSRIQVSSCSFQLSVSSRPATAMVSPTSMIEPRLADHT
ncbi:hypothetical protein BKA81DRAFT_61933 [Phyllosticta paracitricarpa]